MISRELPPFGVYDGLLPIDNEPVFLKLHESTPHIHDGGGALAASLIDIAAFQYLPGGEGAFGLPQTLQDGVPSLRR